MLVDELIARSLRELGKDVLFGLMGDANMRYIARYLRDHGRFIPSVDEGGAVGMCDGYSRASGISGVVSVTHGPGVTNTLTALTEAVRARSSFVLLVSTTPPVKDHPQWLDLRTAAELTGAGYIDVRRPGDVQGEISQAFRRSSIERRPILLDIPVVMLDAEVEYRAVEAPGIAASAQRPGPDPEVLDAALGIAMNADRPIVLAGRGAVRSGAGPALLRLADRLPAATATTLLAAGVFRGHPLDLGIFGTLAHPEALDFIAGADCVLAFGAGLSLHTTVDGDLLRGKTVVQCDTDPTAINQRWGRGLGVVADARQLATAMADALEVAGHDGGKAMPGWAAGLQATLAGREPWKEFTDRSTGDTIDIRTAMLRLDEILPAERTIVSDVGRFCRFPWRLLRLDADRFWHTGSFGSIGLGLSLAIGAAIARSDQLTVALVGDGGGMMGISELTVAARERLPLLVVVLDDAAYGAECRKLAEYGLDPDYGRQRWPEFAGLAEAYGADAAVARSEEDVLALKSRLTGLSRPFLLDVKLDAMSIPNE